MHPLPCRYALFPDLLAVSFSGLVNQFFGFRTGDQNIFIYIKRQGQTRLHSAHIEPVSLIYNSVYRKEQQLLLLTTDLSL
jgi:hypothetical protein